LVLLAGFALAASLVSSSPMHGFSAPTLAAQQSSGEFHAHGQVCRRTPFAFPTPQAVRLEWRDKDGRVVDVARAELNGELAGRAMGCSRYSVTLHWRPGDADTVKVQPLP
jgi:hypothetical protein